MKGKLLAMFIPFLIIAAMAGVALYFLLQPEKQPEKAKEVVVENVGCQDSQCVDVTYFVSLDGVKREFSDDELTVWKKERSEKEGLYNYFYKKEHADEAFRRLKQTLVDYRGELNEGGLGEEGN